MCSQTLIGRLVCVAGIIEIEWPAGIVDFSEFFKVVNFDFVNMVITTIQMAPSHWPIALKPSSHWPIYPLFGPLHTCCPPIGPLHSGRPLIGLQVELKCIRPLSFFDELITLCFSSCGILASIPCSLILLTLLGKICCRSEGYARKLEAYKDKVLSYHWCLTSCVDASLVVAFVATLSLLVSGGAFLWGWPSHWLMVLICHWLLVLPSHWLMVRCGSYFSSSASCSSCLSATRYAVTSAAW